jgi:ERCC4-type nuclease
MRIPAELKPDQVVAVIDSREQLPLDLTPLRTVTGTLTSGDYSVLGLVDVVAIERKSLSDLLGCVGTDRERFDREVQRLLAYPVRALVIESTWTELEAGGWRSRITPAAAVGSLLGWIAAGLPVIMAGDRARAGRYVSRLLFTAARRRWRELRALATVVEIEGTWDELEGALHASVAAGLPEA